MKAPRKTLSFTLSNGKRARVSIVRPLGFGLTLVRAPKHLAGPFQVVHTSGGKLVSGANPDALADFAVAVCSVVQVRELLEETQELDFRGKGLTCGALCTRWHAMLNLMPPALFEQLESLRRAAQEA